MSDDYAMPGKRKTKRDLKKKAKQGVYKKGGGKRSESLRISKGEDNKKSKKTKKKKR